MIGRVPIRSREEPGLGYAEAVGGTRYVFADLKTLLARATPPRSGDRLAELAAADMTERVAAQLALAELPLRRLIEEPVLPYETDEITRLIIDGHDGDAFAAIAVMTVGELRDWLLSDAVDTAALAHLVPGLTPEIVAAVNGRVPILFDSGIRRGTDILKALALGANAVCLGRIPRWGLGAYGPEGVTRVLEIMQAELVQAMAYTGRPSLDSIDKTLVRTDFA